MPREQSDFNYRHSATRVVVEHAFGLLKKRFRLLGGTLHRHDPAEYVTIIGVGCILHNIMMDEVLDDEVDGGVRLRNPKRAFTGNSVSAASSGGQVTLNPKL